MCFLHTYQVCCSLLGRLLLKGQGSLRDSKGLSALVVAADVPTNSSTKTQKGTTKKRLSRATTSYSTYVSWLLSIELISVLIGPFHPLMVKKLEVAVVVTAVQPNLIGTGT